MIMQLSFCKFANIMKKSFFLLTLFLSPLFGGTLIDYLSSLQKGEIVVYQFRQSVSAVCVEESALRILTTTSDTAAREGYSSWLDWVNDGAPGFLNDETIGLKNGKIERIKALSSDRLAWFITLLQLNLVPLPLEQRRRAGPPPRPGERDFRPIWQPKIIVHSKVIESKSEAFTAQWPKDSSPMADRELVLYFPVSAQAVQALPYRIETRSASYFVQVIDSLARQQ